MVSNTDRGTAERFSRRLAELKETGSMLLILGADPAGRNAVSRQLLGAASMGRSPVFALLGRDRTVVETRSPGTPVGDSQIVEYDFPRSASRATVEETGSPPRPTPSSQPLESLETLAAEIRGMVEALEDNRTEALEPGELRLCLDSLGPVIDGFGRGAVEAFTDELHALMTGRAGMGHAILPRASLPGRYDWLESAFDGVVETRVIDGTAQERWRLVEGDLATDWFRVEAVEGR